MFASKDTLLTRPSGYTIARSVRLRSSASAYLNRTFGSGSRTTWTWSAWVKRGALGTSPRIFQSSGAGGFGVEGFIDFANDNIRLRFEYNGGSQWQLITTAVYRDPSAWYHIVCVADSTNATASNRLRIYVNGVQVTAFSTANYPTQSANGTLNQAYSHGLGANASGGDYFDGYLTEVNFIDGQALTPSSFGSTNAITGVWQPAKYTGTYGTNGFYLNFSDNSASTAATIGKDYSGNGNNWTPNIISITAGVTYDSMLDSPTPYADGGNGRGNYSVFNPVNVSGGGTTTITDGNLATSVGSTTTYGKILGSVGMSTGKWYWEVLVTAIGGAGNIGIGDGTAPSASFGLGGVSGELSYQSSGNKYTNNSGTAYGATYTTNDIIGVAYDADAGSITFYKNNTSQGAITGFSGTKYAAVGSGGGTNPQYAINFGQRPFSYTPPTGFVALNTQNLPTPTISNGASYMAATTYTGTGSALTVANTVGSASFQPDWVWVKSRSAATDHALYDAVRGVQKQLESNTTTAETTETTGLTAFGSTGFTVGALAQMNTSAATYVAWQWNAGGSTVTNTSGSISAQVRANATAGFSVVTYTGTGANATVGHGLGVAPKMIIVKRRNGGGTENWMVYHISLGAANRVLLNLTNASNTDTAIWNSTTPTSTVFSVGTSSETNANTGTYVAYCFSEVAGYSKFGSYTGNLSTDGPFVFTGFRPRFVMFKRTDAVASWRIIDTAREPINATQTEIYPNLANAEGSAANGMDILSNGFKLRGSYAEWNASGGTYIYACFAENPFKNSLAR